MVKSIKLKLRSPFRNEDIFCADTKTVNEFMKQVRIFLIKENVPIFFSLTISEKNSNKFLFFLSPSPPDLTFYCICNNHHACNVCICVLIKKIFTLIIKSLGLIIGIF